MTFSGTYPSDGDFLLSVTFSFMVVLVAQMLFLLVVLVARMVFPIYSHH